MSVVGSLDEIATKVDAVAGIKKAYSVGVASDVSPMPRGIEDGPVALVMLRGGSQVGGNAEALLLDVAVEIWVPAENAAWAHKTLVQFIDLVRTAMRADMNLGGECTRAHMAGVDATESQVVGDRTYLVMPIVVEVLIERYGTDASA